MIAHNENLYFSMEKKGMKYDIAIVGGGAMGACAAYWLSKEKKVILLEQFTINNELNASIDYSKIFRYEYGEETVYTQMAVESLKLWKEIEKECGKQLYFQTGLLLPGGHEESYIMKSYESLKKLGHGTELLEGVELERRYPQFKAKFAVVDTNGGVLEANSVVNAFITLAKKNGAVIRENVGVKKVDAKTVILENGETIECEKIVVVSGSWIRKLLPKLPITPTKQEVVYFKPEKPEHFTKEVFPVFIHGDRGYYGVPIHGINAVKVGNHAVGKPVDPENLDWVVSKEAIDGCRNFIKEYIPELGDAKIVKAKVCLYDMSPDNHFIIEEIDGIIVGCGFSGHGFKFASLIGKMLADLALNRENSYLRYFSAKRFENGEKPNFTSE